MPRRPRGEEAAATYVRTRCHAEERERWRRAAEARGVPLAELIRTLLDREARRVLG